MTIVVFFFVGKARLLSEKRLISFIVGSILIKSKVKFIYKDGTNYESKK